MLKIPWMEFFDWLKNLNWSIMKIFRMSADYLIMRKWANHVRHTGECECVLGTSRLTGELFVSHDNAYQNRFLWLYGRHVRTYLDLSMNCFWNYFLWEHAGRTLSQLHILTHILPHKFSIYSSVLTNVYSNLTPGSHI